MQVVNRFRKRKPRHELKWWKRRSAIEPVIGHLKSDHYMARNMLGGVTGDRINAVLSAVGFNLVKLMKGLKRKWIDRLLLCLRTVAGEIAGLIAESLVPDITATSFGMQTTDALPAREKWRFA